MPNRPHLYLVDGPHFLRVRDLERATAELARDSSIRLLVVEERAYLDGSSRLRVTGRNRLDEIQEEVGLSAESAVTGELLLLPGLAGMSGLDMQSVQVRSTDRVCLVEIAKIGQGEIPWPRHVPSLTLESVVSEAMRAAGSDPWAEMPMRLSEQLGSISLLQLGAEQAHLAKIAGDQVAGITRGSIGVLLQTKERRHSTLLLAAANGIPESTLIQRLESSVAQVDGLVSMISAAELVRLHEDSLRTATQLREREDRESDRDRWVARLAAAFLLPTLWLSFAGTNVLPMTLFGHATQSRLYTVVVIVVTIALGFLGWFAIPLSARRKSK